ncbi:hypothetical protein KI387_003828, partial [Taxus chinensis]
AWRVWVLFTVGLVLTGFCEGYGNSSKELSRARHPWRGPIGTRHIVVDQTGAGDFLTVQAAVESVADGNRERIIIHIHPGYYVEKVTVPATKPYITFQGAGKEFTVIEWHNRACDLDPTGQQLRTYHSASVTVLANHFTAMNISFKNTAPAPMPGMEGWQAVAFRISGDKAYFLGCGFYGAQDTLCDDAGRHYFKECYIEGSIDFIFGNGEVHVQVQHCELHSIAQEFGSVAAQDRGLASEKTGFAFVQCRVTGTGPLYIGRAMGQYSRIVYAYTYFDDIVARVAWDDWDHQTIKDRCRNIYSYIRLAFAVLRFLGCTNVTAPGAPAARGVSWAHELTPEQARPFLVKSY